MLLWDRDEQCAALRALDPAVVALPFNPTAENLTRHIVTEVGPDRLAGTGVRITACTVHETGKCKATFRL
jgi:6-pyruvoyltetrahydropterin/6-carboxytetrahydropterin synthase